MSTTSRLHTQCQQQTQGKDGRPVPTVPVRKPKPKPARFVRVIEQPTPDTDGWGAIEIQVGKQVDRYLVHFIPTDFGDGAVAFEVEKVNADCTGTVEQYHVHLSGNPADCHCTCPGGTYKGHCKHAEGLAALRASGQLAATPAPPPARPKWDERFAAETI